uniref:Uncharacterized protein n=1 Tax=Anguilla anguilla TaxID=7936 RepID=A0A0E9VTA1_ANGAN
MHQSSASHPLANVNYTITTETWCSPEGLRG